jgi:hypothetical protein
MGNVSRDTRFSPGARHPASWDSKHSVRLGTKEDCDGEGQQQYTWSELTMLGVGRKADDIPLWKNYCYENKEVKSRWSDARQTWQNTLGKAMFTNDENDLLLWMVKHAEGFK